MCKLSAQANEIVSGGGLTGALVRPTDHLHIHPSMLSVSEWLHAYEQTKTPFSQPFTVFSTRSQPVKPVSLPRGAELEGCRIERPHLHSGGHA